MNNSVHQSSWIDKAIYAWTKSGTKLQPGLSKEEILEFELQLDFKLPKDFFDLYQRVNGFSDLDWNEHMFSFWSLERILEEYKSDNDKEFIGFCDFLINSYSIGFSKDDKKVFKSFDGLEPVSATFEEAVMLINSSAGNIY